MVFNESSASNSKFDVVADIHPGKENMRINVRVLRLWKVPTFLNPSENGSIEMVLVDENGGKIHATIKKQLIYMFQTKIEEGKTYDISWFAVYPQSDVCAHTHDYEFLVDVIGYMTGLPAEREYIRDGKITKMVIAELTDHSGKCEIALFGDYADDLTKKMGKLSGGLPVVVVQFAKVKIFRDKASLQNVMNTTRIFINPDIAEVESFRNNVGVHGVELDSSVPLLGQHAKPSFEEEFLRMHPIKSVGQLDSLEEGGVSVVCAEVVGIVDGSDWWYPACKCHRSVVAYSGSYFCSSSDTHVFQVVPRFRVKVEVTDGNALAVFVIFDSEMSYVMEKSCVYFVSQAKVCSGSSHPNEFDGLVGKKMLFSVQRSPQLGLAISSYRVKRICMDPVVIEKFCSEISHSTSTKIMQPAIDLESDGGPNDADGVLDSQSIEFLEDVIVTPTNSVEMSIGEDEMEVPFKRNLAKAFNSAPKRQGNKRFKPVKIKKE
ncbi:replication protein A 70 kDa DNA-binding subunit C [Trifolium repens]|nr:replication protein A 70 kDa DNA-binding subunit C [Trifolium repens]